MILPLYHKEATGFSQTPWKVFSVVVACVGVLMLATGCNPVPTAAPIVEQRWKLAVADSSLGVTEFLPNSELPLNTADTCSPSEGASRAFTDDNGITVDVNPMCRSWSFATLCPSCQLRLPKPAFKASQEMSWALPDPFADTEIVAVTISGGEVDISVSHTLSFTPFHKGELKVVAQSLGGSAASRVEAVLDEDMAPGKTVSMNLDFDTGAPVTFTGGLKLVFLMDAKADSVDVDFGQASSIDVRAQVKALTFDSVTLRLKDKKIELPADSFDTQQRRRPVLRHRKSRGSRRRRGHPLTNPFDLSASANLKLGETEKEIEIEERRTSVISFDYTGDEIASFLEGELEYALSAVFPDGEVTLGASDKIAIKVIVDATLRTEPVGSRSDA